MPKKLILNDDQLVKAVAASTSFGMVARSLRPELPQGIYGRARRRALELKLDTSHFTRRKQAKTRWTDEALRAAVATSMSLADVLRKLGLVPAGGNYDAVQRKIAEAALDTSHFTGQGWNVGGKFVPAPARPLEHVLVAGQWTASHKLKQRLFREGLKCPACELCGWAERSADGRVPVELDHINGDRNDNRLVNLRVLCPNCHSLQPTHRGLNQKRARAGRESTPPEHMRGWYSLPRAVRLELRECPTFGHSW